jgi:hypothetical protein
VHNDTGDVGEASPSFSSCFCICDCDFISFHHTLLLLVNFHQFVVGADVVDCYLGSSRLVSSRLVVSLLYFSHIVFINGTRGRAVHPTVNVGKLGTGFICIVLLGGTCAKHVCVPCERHDNRVNFINLKRYRHGFVYDIICFVILCVFREHVDSIGQTQVRLLVR